MIKIKNDFLEIEVSKVGAELQSVKNQEGIEFLWQGNPEYWSGKATNLFPFIGRLSEGKYTYEGREHLMNNHGFCRGNQFNVINHSDTSVELYIESTAELLEIYPFKFRFSIIYTLEQSKLAINYKVINMDHKSIYFAVGGHPGFYVPINEKGQFKDYYLEFQKPCHPTRMGVSKSGFMNGKDVRYELENDNKILLEHTLFDKDAIVLKDMSNTVKLVSDISANEIEIGYPQMKYLAIWQAAKKDTPFLCIEPWTTLPAREGIVEDITTHPDMNKLEPGCIYENNWWIQVK